MIDPSPRSGIPDNFIRGILDRFSPSLEAMGIQIMWCGNAAASRLFDPDFLDQILGNLINNVEKYAAMGGHLKVVTYEDRDQLVIRIEDRGPGVPIHERERIFEPFERLRNDINSAAGTGLGLTIARRLARSHGGDVRLLESSIGCCFEVTLLARRVETANETANESNQNQGESS